MNTALILSYDEWYGLVMTENTEIPEPLSVLLIEMNNCKNNRKSDITASLINKRLARLGNDALILNPLLSLMVSEAQNAQALRELASDTFALSCQKLHILFTRYEWMQGSWRISAFQDMDSLVSSLEPA